MANVMRLPNAAPREKWAERISSAWRDQVPSIFETGNLLEAAKAELKHGEWLKMIKEELPFTKGTANKLMAIAADDKLRNDAVQRHLPANWTILCELSRLTENQFNSGIKSGAIHPRMKTADAKALRGIEPKERKKKEQYPTDLTGWLGHEKEFLTQAAHSLKYEEVQDLFGHLRQHMDNLERRLGGHSDATGNP